MPGSRGNLDPDWLTQDLPVDPTHRPARNAGGRSLDFDHRIRRPAGVNANVPSRPAAIVRVGVEHSVRAREGVFGKLGDGDRPPHSEGEIPAPVRRRHANRVAAQRRRTAHEPWDGSGEEKDARCRKEPQGGE